MNGNAFWITGRVVDPLALDDEEKPKGIAGVTVEAWDRDIWPPGTHDWPLGKAITKEDGSFDIAFGAWYLPTIWNPWKFFSHTRPDLYFKLSYDGEPIDLPDERVRWDIELGGTYVVIEIDDPTAKKPALPKRSVVRGRLSEVEGEPILATIRVFHEGFKNKTTELAETVTDDQGTFLISYTAEQLVALGERQADLRVRAYEKGQEIAWSRHILNAAPVEEVQLVRDNAEFRGPPEYAQLERRLAPRLENTDPADLSEQDIAYLVEKTGLGSEQVADFAAAARLAAALADQGTGVDAQPLYGLLRQGLPKELPALLSQRQPFVERALKKAIKEKNISIRFTDQIDDIIKQLQEAAVVRAMGEADEPGRYTLGQLLERCLPDQELRRTLVEGYLQHEGSVDLFWRDVLPHKAGFKDDELRKTIRLVHDLGVLTDRHLPLVRELEKLREGNGAEDFAWGELKTLESLRDLAILPVKQLNGLGGWLELIGLKVGDDGERVGFPPDTEGDDWDEMARAYATTLADRLAEAYPSAATARQIKEQALPPIVTDQADLVQFLGDSEQFADFHLFNTNVDYYFAVKRTELQQEFKTQGKIDSLAESLRKVQRVWRLIPDKSPEDRNRLLQEGIDSARQIVQMGQTAFVNKIDLVGDDESRKKWRAVFSAARYQTAAATAIYGRFAPAINGPMVAALGGPPLIPPSDGDAQRQPINLPLKVNDDVMATWSTLFGPSSYCSCDHCESVFGPAAYLADLLNFLRHKQVLHILLQRRPEIGHIELSCENAKTPLPYIDLVNEILESAIETKGQTFDRQTRNSADELRAMPQYVNGDVYEHVIREAVYPWTLPFDLWTEQSRAYLAHLQVPRYRLLEVFDTRCELRFDDPIIAREVLELSSKQRDLLLNEKKQAWLYWGLKETGNIIPDPDDRTEEPLQGSWITLLSKVPVFLDRSGFDFKQVLELLESDYVKSDGVIEYCFVDPDDECACLEGATCDLSKVELRRSDCARFPDDFKRIHLFLRLQRFLGWGMRDLDRVLNWLLKWVPDLSVNPISISDDSLAVLAGIQRLRERLQLPTVRLLGLWTTIDTRNYEQGDGPDKSSLYDQLFLSKTLGDPEKDPLQVFALTAGRDQIDEFKKCLDKKIPGECPKLLEHLPALAGGLTSDASDIDRIISERVERLERGEKLEGKPPWLTLSNISALYRIVTLAKALDLGIEDFLAAESLIAGAPSFVRGEAFESPQATLKFITRLERLQTYGFSIEEADYLLRHRTRRGSNLPLDETAARLFLDDLESALNQLEDQTPQAADNLIIERLARNLGVAPDVIRCLACDVLISDAGELSHALVRTRTTANKNDHPAITDFRALCQDFCEGIPALYGSAGAPRSKSSLAQPAQRNDEGFLANYYQDDEDPPNKWLDKHFCAPAVTRRDSSINFNWGRGKPDELVEADYFSVRWHGCICPEETEDFTFTATADDGVRLWVNNILLIDQWEDQSATEYQETIRLENGEPAEIRMEYYERRTDALATLQWKGQTTNKQPPTTRFHYLKALATYKVLAKAAWLVRKLNISSVELGYLASRLKPAERSLFDQLPWEECYRPSPAYSDFESFCRLFINRDLLALNGPQLVELLTFASENQKATFLEALHGHTHWPKDDLKLLLGDANSPGDLGLGFPDDYTSSTVLERAHACFKLSHLTGTSIRDLIDWTDHMREEGGTMQDDAFAVKQAVRAKYDESRWLDVAQAIEDVLRQEKRAALVDYLVAHAKDENDKRRFLNNNHLFFHYLIDVEMDPCQLTSRIVQANAAVQLFVQRALMGFEGQVQLDEDAKREWEWRKQYRLWEANRKIFLYPENWLEPELRDDKSPFFVEMENELMQQEITEETATTAFRNYLYKLNEVARLEICCFAVEDKSDNNSGIHVLHVIGRTAGTPHTYYYRRRDQNHSWTAWEKVDVDFGDSEHFAICVWNGRLLVFWLIHTERAKQISESMDDPPDKYWEVQVAFSEYKNRTLSPRKISKALDILPCVSARSSSGAESLVIADSYDRKHQAFFVIPSATGGIRLELYCGAARYVDTCRITPPKHPNVAIDYAYFVNRTLIGVFVFNEFPDVTSGEEFEVVDIQGSSSWWDDKYEYNKKRDLNNEDIFAEELNDPFVLGVSHPLWGFSSKQPYWIKFPVFEPLESYWFLENDRRTFLLEYYEESVFHREPIPDSDMFTVRAGLVEGYSIEPHYHPYVPELLRKLSHSGLDGILDPPPDDDLCRQRIAADFFEAEYGRSDKIEETSYPRDEIDFASYGAYALYNWELFFHAPFLIANRLATNRRFEEALRWYHFIFDPNGQLCTDGDSICAQEAASSCPELFGSGPGVDSNSSSRFWKFRRFYCNQDAKIAKADLLALLGLDLENPGGDDSGCKAELSKKRKEIEELIKQWENDPFKPHLVARQRITAYQKAVVMKYLDTLIAWGDDLFRRGTFESINEATNLYVLAAEILGKRPQEISPAQEPERATFCDLSGCQPCCELYLEDAQNIAEESEILTELKKDLEAKPDLCAIMVVRTDTDPAHWIIAGRSDEGTFSDLEINPSDTAHDSLRQWWENREGNRNSILELAATLLGLCAPKGELDRFSNALIALENWAPLHQGEASVDDTQGDPLVTLGSLYFCVPPNSKLLQYWTRVEDRLFKIRHCLTVEGKTRQTPLFAPPIEPGLLARAAAAGVDLSSVLSEVSAPQPVYRFSVWVQKAAELCGEVKALGNALLSALEKRDAEELARIRSTNELNLLRAVRDLKISQKSEAEKSHEALKKSKELAEARNTYYKERKAINELETDSLKLHAGAIIPNTVALAAHTIGAILAMGPNFKIGSPATLGTTYGGDNLRQAVSQVASAASVAAGMLNSAASIASTLAQYQRRKEEWDFQADLAKKETEQIDEQILAASERMRIATKDLENHDLQIENAAQVDETMRSKYTNQELYDWMVGQISGIFFQSYQLAYDVAKRAEKALQFELRSTPASTFIEFGYWDSLKKGLLAGDKLYHDIKRMEVAYLDQNKRECEITKHISLRQLDPAALVSLQQTGACFVSFPEILFDIDCPGHYMRRIKSVSLTLPCVTGPYTGVNCALTLLKSSIRHDDSLETEYARDTKNHDTRFVEVLPAKHSIVTSGGQNDSGLFETNLRDERYLPFEGAGVISDWKLELPTAFPPFDYGTISDVIFHLRYTAGDGRQGLREAAEGNIREKLCEVAALVSDEEWELATALKGEDSGLFQLLSAKHDFAADWRRFMGTADQQNSELKVRLMRQLFPYQFASRAPAGALKVEQVGVAVVLKSTMSNVGMELKTTPLPEQPKPPPKTPKTTVRLAPFLVDDKNIRLFAGRVKLQTEISVVEQNDAASSEGFFALELLSVDPKRSDGAPPLDNIEDILLVCRYVTNDSSGD